MVLKLYDPHARRRHQQRTQLYRSIFVVFGIIVVLYGSFRLGFESSKANQSLMIQELGTLKDAKSKLEQEAVELRASTMTAVKRFEELERQYQNDIGDENIRKLVILLKERLAAGIKPDRLMTILSKAENIRQCSTPETKRFILKTDVSRGPASSNSFANSSIIVTGTGQPTVNDKGAKESWFDPAQPVSIQFKTNTGEETKAEGVLPLHHSIVQGNAEYRFTISKGARSFIEISADQCAYP